MEAQDDAGIPLNNCGTQLRPDTAAPAPAWAASRGPRGITPHDSIENNTTTDMISAIDLSHDDESAGYPKLAVRP